MVGPDAPITQPRRTPGVNGVAGATWDRACIGITGEGTVGVVRVVHQASRRGGAAVVATCSGSAMHPHLQHVGMVRDAQGAGTLDGTGGGTAASRNTPATRGDGQGCTGG